MANELQMVNPPQEEQEYLSMAEAGKDMLITDDSFRHLVKRHAQYLTQYISKRDHHCTVSGLTRRMTVITRQGFVVLNTIKDSARNQEDKTVVKRLFSENDAVIDNSSSQLQGKKDVAEIALFATTPSSDPMMATLQQMMMLRQQQMSHEDRLTKIEQLQEAAVKDLLELPPARGEVKEPTARRMLGKAVYNYSVYAKIKPEDAWVSIYDHLLMCHNINVKTRADNRDVKPIDIIEEAGLLDVSYDYIKSKIDRLTNPKKGYTYPD